MRLTHWGTMPPPAILEMDMIKDHEMARLRDNTGRAVYTTSGLPVTRGWFKVNFPSVVQHNGRLYYDTGTSEFGFRIYNEAPTLVSMGE